MNIKRFFVAVAGAIRFMFTSRAKFESDLRAVLDE